MQDCQVCAAKLVQWPIKYYSYTKKSRVKILNSLFVFHRKKKWNMNASKY